MVQNFVNSHDIANVIRVQKDILALYRQDDAGVAIPCYNLQEPKVPLKINEQSGLFKLFMNDCGLLCTMGMENVQFSILQGNLTVNMGSVLENVFAQQLTSN